MAETDLREEERELDRRIDLINVIFGAALGGYIDLSSPAPVAIGWAAAFAVVVSSHLIVLT